MTKQTLQEFINRDVKVIDILANEIHGTLMNVTEESITLRTSRNTVIISLDYIAQFLVKHY